MNKRPITSNPSTTPPPVLPPRGLRIMDAARYAGLSPFYVETLVRSGELPALKLCQHYTILREDLDAFLDRKRGELLGANGTGWQESDAVPERRPLRSKC